MEKQESYAAVWDDCLQVIKQVIEPQQFSTWFEPIRPVSLEGSVLTIAVPSDFFREYIEEAYLDVLKMTLKRVIGAGAKLVYNIRPVKVRTINVPGQEVLTPVNPSVMVASTPSDKPSPFVYPGIHKVKIDPRLNPSYCFANLVEGECNKLGISAGINITAAPGKTAFLFLFSEDQVLARLTLLKPLVSPSRRNIRILSCFTLRATNSRTNTSRRLRYSTRLPISLPIT